MIYGKSYRLAPILRFPCSMQYSRRILNIRSFISINDTNINSTNSSIIKFSGIHEHAYYFSNIVNFLKRDLLDSQTKILQLKNLTLQPNVDQRHYLYITLKDSDHFLIAENESYMVYLCGKDHSPVARIKRLLDDISAKMYKSEYCAEIVYEDHNIVIRDDHPEDYYIKIVPNIIMYERSLDSIRENLTNHKFPLHPHNLTEEFIKNLNHYQHSILEDHHLNDLDHIEPANIAQKRAIHSALTNKVTLVQGPPGTGKTETCASLIAEYLQREQGKVLVCAASNIAVDNIAEKIDKKGINVVRVYPRYLCDEDYTKAPDYSLHKRISRLMHKTNDEKLVALHNLVIENKYTVSSQMDLYSEMIFSKEVEVLNNCDVVCCSCVLSGSPLIRHFKYGMVLVDEASQPTEPEVLIPLTLSTDKIVLVGDHKQLGPVIHPNFIDEAAKLTLFERLVKCGIQPILLDTQYRMHPLLSEFSSREFYDNKIINGITQQDRTHSQLTFKWPKPNIPMFFKATYGSEDTPLDSKSHFNMAECKEVIKITFELIKNGVAASTIGIISPYAAQRNLIISELDEHVKTNPNVSGVVVASVHAFQGREKDYIIISCVRSNELQSVGFLIDPKQLNVAISRAKYGLIIVGNPLVLRNSPVWNNYLDFFKEKDIIVTGDYPNMKPITNYP